MKTNIFISHSCKDDETGPVDPGDRDAVERRKQLEFARDLRSEIVRRLTATNKFDSWFDKDVLKAGTEWRKAINKGLETCRGGVLLLSPQALESDWVLKESTILTWRHELGAGLTIIALLLCGVTVADLEKKGFGPAGLPGLQLLPIQGQEKSDIDAAAAEVVQTLETAAPDHCDTQMNLWIADIRSALSAVGMKITHVDQMFRILKLGQEAKAWHDPNDYKGVIARELLVRGGQAAERILNVVQGIGTPDKRKTLADLMKPTWVPAPAAKNIPRIARKQSQKRLIAINAKNSHSGRQYIKRAFCGHEVSSRVLAPADSGGSVEQIVSIFRDEINEYYDPTKLEDEVSKDGPLFLIVGKAAATKIVIDRLLNAFPAATLVVMCGNDEQLLEKIPELELLEPELGENDEMDARRFENRLERTAANQ